MVISPTNFQNDLVRCSSQNFLGLQLIREYEILTGSTVVGGGVVLQGSTIPKTHGKVPGSCLEVSYQHACMRTIPCWPRLGGLWYKDPIGGSAGGIVVKVLAPT